MVLYIKNMVSLRCKMMVAEELVKIGIPYTAIDLGVVEIPDGITYQQQELLKANLLAIGLELLWDKKNLDLKN